jgi:hydroxymethylpyrimidine pyrophosphatase-like HAD family hydrolase
MNKRDFQIYAIDYDGTLVAQDYSKDWNTVKCIPERELLPYAKEVVNALYDRGDKIIIWTCRYEEDSLAAMKSVLDKNGIKYHKINENDDSLEFKPQPKVFADVYIDDRNFGKFLGWEIIGKQLGVLL